MGSDEDTGTIRLDLARLEGKLDVAITGQGAEIRDLRKDVDDHESRLRTEEQRPRVTPKHLYAGLSTAVLLLTGAAYLIKFFQ
ncbi:hypothetical protein [Glycomyces paridis]|uniref:Uncharacterized protein n=1 Tax=Glycomyces paridis TaxID=2126555 RepID=A0A4V4HNJ5_9ACTN|nr:hypothetical protein [Glycomyces paridis]THV26016.1 hypothetical protein E9998_20000 [Glycomyces paridis]